MTLEWLISKGGHRGTERVETYPGILRERGQGQDLNPDSFAMEAPLYQITGLEGVVTTADPDTLTGSGERNALQSFIQGAIVSQDILHWD